MTLFATQFSAAYLDMLMVDAMRIAFSFVPITNVSGQLWFSDIMQKRQLTT